MQGPMTYEEICDAIYELHSDCIDLERQLEMYSNNPKSPDWPAKAKAALRIKMLQIQDLERRQKLLEGFSQIDTNFVASAKVLLTPEVFHNIMEDAKARLSA